MMNAFATAISLGLQYGVPLETFVNKFCYMRFDPEGITKNPEIPFAKSMPDYIMRWLASRFIDDLDDLEELGIMTQEVRARQGRLQQAVVPPTAEHRQAGERQRLNGHGNGGNGQRRQRRATRRRPSAGRAAGQAVPPRRMHRHARRSSRPASQGGDLGPACDQCGGMMQRTGSCYTCSSCGNNTGCG